MKTIGLRVWLSLAALVLGGCVSSGAGSLASGSGHRHGTRERIMVFLPPWSDSALQRLISELSRDFALTPISSWQLESLGESCWVFEVLDSSQDPRTLAQRLAVDPRIRAASAVETFRTLEEPYRDLQHALDEINAEPAHQLATGRGVRIAVVDTGVDFDHPDLRGRVVEARNFVAAPHGDGFTGDRHGTAVAGVIGAARNGEGVLGVAPDAELLALKACWPDGSGASVCRSDSLVLALDFALGARARIINLSLAGPSDPGVGRLLDVALGRGTVVIAAAAGASDRETFPASWPGVVGVSGRDGTGLLAPALDVLTTIPVGRYDFVSGTSVAAALVSGVAALVLELAPELTPAQVRQVLWESATPRDGAADSRFLSAAGAARAAAARLSVAAVGQNLR